MTVRTLIARPALGLRLRTPPVDLDRAIHWVHVSELADPTPFLEGGELLLTTGLAVRGDVSVDDYVDRLVACGAAGLGFGTGVGHDVVPGDLIAAAGRRGLPLVEVPRATPFIAISRTVSAALAADEYASVARVSVVQQNLVRAALAPGAPATVLERLVREVGGWALLLDPTGTPLDAVPATAAGRAAGLRRETDRLRGSRASASATIVGPDETVLIQAVGTGDRVRGFLVLGRPTAPTAAERYLVHTAVLLLSLRLEQSRALDSGMAALRTALLQLLLAGQGEVAADVVRELGGQMPPEPLSVVVVSSPGGLRAAAVDVVADAAAHERAAFFSAELDGVLVVLLSATGPVVARLPDLAGRVPGAAVGVSGPVSWSDLAVGLRQARQAADHGRARGSGTTVFTDLASPGVTGLLDPTATRAFAEALLTPLLAADRAGPGDLVESLRVWLAHHGQWEPAAARLGVHRHTLRKRIHRVAELLGRDVDQPGTRVDLWVAVHALTTTPDTARP